MKRFTAWLVNWLKSPNGRWFCRGISAGLFLALVFELTIRRFGGFLCVMW